MKAIITYERTPLGRRTSKWGSLLAVFPVAAHDVIGPRDIITNGVDGYLGDNLRDSAAKCLELSRTDYRKKAEQFSWEKSSDIFIKNIWFLH